MTSECAILRERNSMRVKAWFGAIATVTAALIFFGETRAQDSEGLGTEEFGLTKRQLVQNIEAVEGLIAECMREQGFEYFAVDYATVRKGMLADKSIRGLSEEEFIEEHGFGLSTLYTGLPPQLATGYNPGGVGLGERNIELFQSLSPADQQAYNFALFGEDATATFAVGLEQEDLSRCGGCTRKAIEKVFTSSQLQATYYNPKDALINEDPRMKKALKEYAEEMRDAGFNYDHPDEVEADIRERLDALTDGGTLALDDLTAEQREALAELQSYERRVAMKNFELAEDLFEPVEEKIEREMFAREVK